MAFDPGRNVGRLSIRVVPDTKKFRNDLKRQLETVERTTTATIRVTRADLDRNKIREDIRRQMEEMRGIEVDAKVKVTVDKARLKKTALRKSIQDQFDKFENIRVNIEAAIKNPEHFHKEVKDMTDRASRLKVKINVNAVTMAASAQMKWVSRDRFVNLIVRVSKKSVAAALTTLAALSGARLSWKWIDDLISKMKDLDKNLPAIVGWTTGITSGIASIFAATSGLVGIGQGLVSITPALLVLPGLLLNALGSATALIVALRNANKELSPLKDEMSALGDIINGQFWGEARQPILDLVTGLMPQLRRAFHDLSQGVGEFTGAMARAFGKELAGGRLESIFKGIADGWRVLGTGADGFAGALVSLSNIAATYTPRLAQWFVRQANTFDKWLKAISTDGRLGDWMETAIGSMYDLWDVTKGVAGVFTGLWKAADQAGSGGLHGFAQLMLTWKRTVNSADFQKGLTAIFRGSGDAMRSFGDAVKAIGRLVADNSRAFETFIASSGAFLGGLLEGIANALNTPLAAEGLDDLSGGLVEALEGVLPHLPRIADTFGNFLGLLGDLARTLLPTAASVLESLMPTIDSLIDAIRPALPGLSDAVTSIAETLAPAVKDFVDVAGPVFVDAIVGLADALVDLAPTIASLVDVLVDLIAALRDWADGNKDFFEGAQDFFAGRSGDEGDKIRKQMEALKKLGRITPEVDDGNPFTVPVEFDIQWEKLERSDGAKKAAESIAKRFITSYNEVLATEGQDAADKLLEGFRKIDGLPPEVIKRIENSLDAGFRIPDLKGQAKKQVTAVVDEIQKAFATGGKDSAEKAWKNLVMGGNGKPIMSPELRRYVKEGLDGLGIEFESAAKDAAQRFSDALKSGGMGGTSGGGGRGFTRSVAQGIRDGQPEVEAASGGLAAAILRTFAGAGTMLTTPGRSVAQGLQNGITSGIPSITTMLAGLAPTLQGAFASAGSWLNPQGVAIAGGLAAGINAGRGSVSGAAGGLRSAVLGGVGSINLYGVGLNLANGIAAGMRDGSRGIAVAAVRAVQTARESARRAAEIRSPSRLMARDVGAPLVQGVAMGIDKAADGVRKSMVNAVDMSGVSGTSPSLAAGGGGVPSGVALHIHNPVVRDLQREAWDAAQTVGMVV
jgi:phage-related protein